MKYVGGKIKKKFQCECCLQLFSFNIVDGRRKYCKNCGKFLRVYRNKYLNKIRTLTSSKKFYKKKWEKEHGRNYKSIIN